MKTTFKKSVLAFLTCVLALAFALTGCSGGGKDLPAAVGAGVVHQIQGQRVAAGVVQHGLCRLQRLLRPVIYYDTSR